jgi:hypothetical protein
MSTNMQELLHFTNTAAAQSDRWLFVALLVVTFATAALVVRWVARRLTLLLDNQTQLIERLVAVVTTNTDALREVRGVMQNCQTRQAMIMPFREPETLGHTVGR